MGYEKMAFWNKRKQLSRIGETTFAIGENSFCTSKDQHAWPDRATPLQNAWSVALNARMHAMMVECEEFIYLVSIVYLVNR